MIRDLGMVKERLEEIQICLLTQVSNLYSTVPAISLSLWLPQTILGSVKIPFPYFPPL